MSQQLHIICVVLLFFAFTQSTAQHSNWHAPASADKLINPFEKNPEAISEGKKIYESMCLVCHGDKGKGNGAASVSLNPHPANFLSIEVRNESDGAIFWKLSEGNPPMASYKTLLTETQRWQVVNYIRKLEGVVK
jgi:mono/diheme cytochrome c family protein